jgi:steroid delta-isomerase-like uncharacterized protein
MNQVIQRYFEQLFNRGNVALVDELLAPDYVNHSPGSADQPRDRTGVVQVVQALRLAFPDLHYRIEQTVESADAVAVRTTMTGTQLGPLFGIPATGKRIEVQQITIEQLRAGKIVAHHRVTDMLALMQQLGFYQSL